MVLLLIMIYYKNENESAYDAESLLCFIYLDQELIFYLKNGFMS